MSDQVDREEESLRAQKAFDAAFRELYPRATDTRFKRQKVAQVLDAFLHSAAKLEGDNAAGRAIDRWKYALRDLS